MSNPDYRQIAREFMPCTLDCSALNGHANDHSEWCLAYRRPILTALLQKTAEEAVEAYQGEQATLQQAETVKEPTHFHPGMKIGPGHGRHEEILKTLIRKGPDGAEFWSVESSTGAISINNEVGYWFCPDDLQPKPTSNLPPEKPPVQCSKCLDWYKDQADLDRHWINDHYPAPPRIEMLNGVPQVKPTQPVEHSIAPQCEITRSGSRTWRRNEP